MNYQIIKLSNGEDIVCKVIEENESEKLKIVSPLRMETVTRETSKGVIESLALSKWVQPYSDEKVFNVQKNSIVIMTPASAGLSKYYEYVLKGMNDFRPPTKKELDSIEEESIESDLLDDLLDKITSKKTTYH